MRHVLRIGLALAVLAGLGLYLVRRDRLADRIAERDRAGRDATAAMAALNPANEDLARWFPPAMSALAGPLVLDPRAASRQLDVDVLPRLDAYLRTADHALATADAYQAQLRDPSLGGAFASIRRRTAALHELRATFAGVRDELARGTPSPADLERITSLFSTGAIRVLLAN